MAASSASGKALVMLHRVMRSVLHRRTDMAIEMARDGGAFVRRHRLFRLL
jgi:1,2-phenylacetyl-CoA epoxidase PaaB subunit